MASDRPIATKRPSRLLAAGVVINADELGELADRIERVLIGQKLMSDALLAAAAGLAIERARMAAHRLH